MPEKVVIDGHELWHGDCREVLPLLAPVDLVLTDPPTALEPTARATRRRMAGWTTDSRAGTRNVPRLGCLG